MALASNRYTPEEYLALERNAEYKSEYIDGQIIAMTGGTSAHSLIAVNIMTELSVRLENSPCLVHNSDMRVKVRQSRMYAYPDVSVVCGAEELEHDGIDTLLNPIVLIEVLSPSTADYDRGLKFVYYSQITSLREYLVVWQDEPKVEHFVLADGVWTPAHALGWDAMVTLPSIGCELPLRRVYRNIKFPDAPKGKGQPRRI